MPEYEITATLTWKIESNHKSTIDVTRVAEKQLNSFIYPPPGMGLTMGVTAFHSSHRPDKKSVIAYFPPDDILYMAKEGKIKRKSYTSKDGKNYCVDLREQKYKVFLKNRKCVCCGLEGTVMALEHSPGCQAVLNFYGEEGGKLVLMTKDHIIPRSKGGRNVMENFVTMCCICNTLKSSDNLTWDQISVLRKIKSNDGRLTKKALNKLINEKRKEFLRGTPTIPTELICEELAAC